MDRFHNRIDAGKQLASLLQEYAHRPDVIVLGLPRGGIPVAFEIAQQLGLPLDTFLVRKLGVPGREELAMGAIALGDVRVFNDNVIRDIGIEEELIEKIIAKETAELNRRNQLYRSGRNFPAVKNKTILLVDDGIATGATMRAAITALQRLHPTKIIVVAPVSAYETYQEFQSLVDEVVCLLTPEFLGGISMWYEDFAQTTDEEVQTLLRIVEKTRK